MSKLKFLSENLILESDITMLAGTENINFPIDNMKRKFTTKVFRSNENSMELLIDLKQTRNVDSFMVVGNALTGLGFTTMKIEGSATPIFSGADIKTVDLNQDFNIGIITFPTLSVRYWKITTIGTGSYTEISKMFIGAANVLEQNAFSIDSFKLKTKDLSSTTTNLYGQEFTDKRSKQSSIAGSIKYCNSAEVLQVDNIMLNHTDRTPLWMIIDEDSSITTDGKFRYSGYFSMQNDIDWSATGVGLFNTKMNLKQVI